MPDLFGVLSLPMGLYKGGIFVLAEMILSISSIMANLMVITAVREKESMLCITYNLILANLCISNLVSAVLVKSISVVHHGHAIASNTTDSYIAFCGIYTISYRSTWGVLPWSIVCLIWTNISQDLKQIQRGLKMRKKLRIYTIERREDENLYRANGEDCPVSPDPSYPSTSRMKSMLSGMSNCSTSSEEPPLSVDGDSESYKMTMFHKGLLGFIWVMGLINGMMHENLLNRDPNSACSIQDDIHSKLTIGSLVLTLALPLLVGPIMSPFIHVILNRVKAHLNIGNSSEHILKDLATKKDEESPSIGLILGLTVIFVITYVMSMVVSETVETISKDVFSYIMVKYIFGTSHQLFTPLWILVMRTDIWENVKDIYKRGGTTQSKPLEITYEQIQKELGLGVGTG